MKLYYKLTNSDSKLIIKKNGNEIQNEDELIVGENNYTLTIIDKNENEYYYNLIVKRSTKSEDILSFITGLILLIGIGYLIHRIKKRKNK